MALRPDELEQRCLRLFAEQAGDAAHDVSHIQRVVANARRLAEAEQRSLEVILPAAWLHDCVVVPKNSPLRAQASRLAAAQATEWLREWGCEEAWLPEIAHAIDAHSFSAGIAPRSLEAKIVQDADRLDALGAVGLARCLMVGGQMGRPLYVESDPFCEQRAADDSKAAVDHFYTKLLTLHETMQTESGREEARRRTEFLKEFLAQLRRELS